MPKSCDCCQLQFSNSNNEGGFLQVQTPLPSGIDSRIPYQLQHLCLISHTMLRTAGIAQGLKIVETLRWPLGQMILFQKEKE